MNNPQKTLKRRSLIVQDVPFWICLDPLGLGCQVLCEFVVLGFRDTGVVFRIFGIGRASSDEPSLRALNERIRDPY